MDFEKTFLLLRDFASIVQLFAAIAGTIFYAKYKRTFLRYFLVLLWYTVLNELLGIFIRDNISSHNAIVYNIYYVINFSLLFLIFKNHLLSKVYRKWSLLFLLIYLISFSINGFFENYIVEFQSFPYIIAACSLIIIIAFYFIEILNSTRVLNVKKNLLFWISIGLLIYYIGNIPFRILRNYYSNSTDLSILFLINIVLTIIMNFCFIIGFIWSDKKQPY